MKEQSLLKLALVCTILGIFVLLVLSDTVELEETKISDAKNMENNVVRITGVVEKATSRGDVTIMTVSKKESIDVVVFDKADFQKGDFVDVTGEVQDYNGRKEIVAKEIKSS